LLGITLKISLSPVDAGGYSAYFESSNRRICGIEIANSAGFAHRCMALWRHKQTRGAFHPVDRIVGLTGDKAYQLRHAINQLNAASLHSFDIGPNLVFDEGGVTCRSRYCPIRQCNPNKPDKFRVGYFILCCSERYVMHHLDVYQGKNNMNINISPSIRDLPTTQKCVLNAIFQCNLNHDSRGARHLAMDNRYACPELTYILREWCGILSSGTCRVQRKGWNPDIMTMKKNKKGFTRGDFKFAFDPSKRIFLFQWYDNKIVNGCTSIVDASVQQVQRQIGSIKETFNCQTALTRYQRTMLCDDKADQM
jgi:hypothetical protein